MDFFVRVQFFADVLFDLILKARRQIKRFIGNFYWDLNYHILKFINECDNYGEGSNPKNVEILSKKRMCRIFL